MNFKVIFCLFLSLLAVNAQVTLLPTTSDTVSTSYSVSITGSGTISNTVSITTSTSVSWTTSTSVSITVSATASGTSSPSPTGTSTISASNSVTSFCGNGVIETALNEECDFGDNKLNKECCNANCKFKHFGASCQSITGVCKAKGRCYVNKGVTGNFAVLCVTTRNQANGAGCPFAVNGTVVKGYCLEGVCKIGRAFK